MPTETKFSIPNGILTLHRHTVDTDKSLRAWDAGDEYALSEIWEKELQKPANKTLVINDGFGALSIGLVKYVVSIDSQIRVISDSVIAHSAIKKNANANGINTKQIQLISRFEFSKIAVKTTYDLVVIKIPKSLAELEDILVRIRPHINNQTQVIGAAMIKRIHNSTLALFEKYLGTTTTSLAKKKARLIYSEVKQPYSDIPTNSAKQFRVDRRISQTPEDLLIASYPGVFCHGSLDYGTELMLKSMKFEPISGPIPEPIKGSGMNILDLGCGSGVLGIAAAIGFPEAKIHFVDESYAAIESVKESITLALPESRKDQYKSTATNCLEGIPDNSQDLILNNPPFHDAAAKTTGVATQMFTESKRVLRSGGQLQVVANRHLGYHKAIKEIFGNCETIASNKKFVILRAIK